MHTPVDLHYKSSFQPACSTQYPYLTDEGIKSNEENIIHRRGGSCFSPNAWDENADANDGATLDPLIVPSSMESTASTWDTRHCLTPSFCYSFGVPESSLNLHEYIERVQPAAHSPERHQHYVKDNMENETGNIMNIDNADMQQERGTSFFLQPFSPTSSSCETVLECHKQKRQRLMDSPHTYAQLGVKSQNNMSSVSDAETNLTTEAWESHTDVRLFLPDAQNTATDIFSASQRSIAYPSSGLTTETTLQSDIALFMSTPCLLDDARDNTPIANGCDRQNSYTDAPESTNNARPLHSNVSTHSSVSHNWHPSVPLRTTLQYPEETASPQHAKHECSETVSPTSTVRFPSTPPPKTTKQANKSSLVTVLTSPTVKLAADTGTTTASIMASPSPRRNSIKTEFFTPSSSSELNRGFIETGTTFENQQRSTFSAIGNAIIDSRDRNYEASTTEVGHDFNAASNVAPSGIIPVSAQQLNKSNQITVMSFCEPQHHAPVDTDAHSSKEHNAGQLEDAAVSPSVSSSSLVISNQRKPSSSSTSCRLPVSRLRKLFPAPRRESTHSTVDNEHNSWGLTFQQRHQNHLRPYTATVVSSSGTTNTAMSTVKMARKCAAENVAPSMYRLPRSPTARAAIVHYPYPPVPAQCLPPLKHTQQQALFNEFLKIETDALRIQLGHFIVEYCTRSIPDEYFRSERVPDPRIITDFVDQIILAVEIFGEHAQYVDAHSAIPTDINEVYISTWLQQKKEFLKPLEMLYRKRQRQKLAAAQNHEADFDEGAGAPPMLLLPSQQRKRTYAKKSLHCAAPQDRATSQSSVRLPNGSIAYGIGGDGTSRRTQGITSLSGKTDCINSQDNATKDRQADMTVRRGGNRRQKEGVFGSRGPLSSGGTEGVGRMARRIGISLGEELDGLGVPRTIHYENLRSAIENRGIVVQLPSNGNARPSAPYFLMESRGMTSTGLSSTNYSQFHRPSLFNLLISGRGDTRRSRLQLPWGDTVNIKYNRTLLGIPDFLVEGLGYGQCGNPGSNHPLIPKVCAVSLEDSLYGVEVLLFYRGLPCNKRVPKRFVLHNSHTNTGRPPGSRRPPPGSGPLRRPLRTEDLPISYYHSQSSPQALTPYLLHPQTSTTPVRQPVMPFRSSNDNDTGTINVLHPRASSDPSERVGLLDISMRQSITEGADWSSIKPAGTSCEGTAATVEHQPTDASEMTLLSSQPGTEHDALHRNRRSGNSSVLITDIPRGAWAKETAQLPATTDLCTFSEHYHEEAQVIDVDAAYGKTQQQSSSELRDSDCHRHTLAVPCSVAVVPLQSCFTSKTETLERKILDVNSHSEDSVAQTTLDRKSYNDSRFLLPREHCNERLVLTSNESGAGGRRTNVSDVNVCGGTSSPNYEGASEPSIERKFQSFGLSADRRKRRKQPRHPLTEFDASSRKLGFQADWLAHPATECFEPASSSTIYYDNTGKNGISSACRDLKSCDDLHHEEKNGDARSKKMFCTVEASSASLCNRNAIPSEHMDANSQNLFSNHSENISPQTNCFPQNQQECSNLVIQSTTEFLSNAATEASSPNETSGFSSNFLRHLSNQDTCNLINVNTETSESQHRDAFKHAITEPPCSGFRSAAALPEWASSSIESSSSDPLQETEALNRHSCENGVEKQTIISNPVSMHSRTQVPLPQQVTFTSITESSTQKNTSTRNQACYSHSNSYRTDVVDNDNSSGCPTNSTNDVALTVFASPQRYRPQEDARQQIPLSKTEHPERLMTKLELPAQNDKTSNDVRSDSSNKYNLRDTGVTENMPEPCHVLQQLNCPNQSLTDCSPNIQSDLLYTTSGSHLDTSFDNALNYMQHVGFPTDLPCQFDIQGKTFGEELCMNEASRRAIEFPLLCSTVPTSLSDTNFRSNEDDHLYLGVPLGTTTGTAGLSCLTSIQQNAHHGMEELGETTERCGLQSSFLVSEKDVTQLDNGSLEYTLKDSAYESGAWPPVTQAAYDGHPAYMFPSAGGPTLPEAFQHATIQTSQVAHNHLPLSVHQQNPYETNTAKQPTRRARLIVSCCATEKAGESGLYRYYNQQLFANGRGRNKTARKWKHSSREHESTLPYSSPMISCQQQHYYNSITSQRGLPLSQDAAVSSHMVHTAYDHTQNHTNFAPQQQAGNQPSTERSYSETPNLTCTASLNDYYYPPFFSENRGDAQSTDVLPYGTTMSQHNEVSCYPNSDITDASEQGFDYCPTTSQGYQDTFSYDAIHLHNPFSISHHVPY